MRFEKVSEADYCLLDRNNLTNALEAQVDKAWKTGNLRFAVIEEVNELLHLRWLHQLCVQRVAPLANMRLEDVVNNTIKEGMGNLNCSCADCTRPGGRSWWDRARDLISQNDFDFNKMRTAAITPLADGEFASIGGTFRVFEGQHRTLVLSLRIMDSATQFEEFRVLLVDPGQSR